MYIEHLTKALDRLFLNKNSLGFWDEESNTIIEYLSHDENWNWNWNLDSRFNKLKNKRYGVFCLASILLAKDYNNLDLKRFDDKIRIFSLKIYKNLSAYSKNDLTYGALLSVILANKFGYININVKIIEDLLTEVLDHAIESFDNQQALVLIPASYFLSDNKSIKIKDRLQKLTFKYLRSVNKSNIFATGDMRFNYHQRIIYPLWGIINASQHCYEENIYNQVKKTLQYVWENRKQDNNIDNAFVWHPKFYTVNNRLKYLPIPIFSNKSSGFLFECHQTFFANTINIFNKKFNEKFMINERDEAMSWIFGANRMNLDLTKVTTLNVPCRIMTAESKLFVGGQNFKGSYEIGSYILELSFRH